MTIEHAMKWAAFKFTATVLDDIWPAVLVFSGVATMVTCVSKFTTTDLSVNSTTLTVLGTIVSLVVSFKTNSSYSRWWDGRNVWANINSNSRQLAMLLWIQVPNVVPPKDGDKAGKDKGKDPAEKKEEEEIDDQRPSRAQGSAEDVERREKQKAVLKGLIEKKTYIGLIQAFAVSLKHALRGENGPFYSDLYSLIAFLPKYNRSAFPPINREHLIVLWQNGIPRQKSYHDDGVLAVPLTQPAAFNGSAFHSRDDDSSDSSSSASRANVSIDQEKNLPGLTTMSDQFKAQAVTSASSFTRSADPNVVAFSRLDRKHRLNRDRAVKDTTPDGIEKVTLTTVELMPPRHPPSTKPWDLFPPLRIYKIITDWFRTQKMKEQMERTQGAHLTCKMYLSAYVSDLIGRGQLNASIISPILTAILELQKALSDLDKLATTPIPKAYSAHLRLTVYAYLFFLPFQLQSYVGWVTIPATAIAAIIYLGFLEIGAQIEMPFANDQSDLDLDKFVLKIAHQLAEVTAFPTSVPSSHVVISSLNQPFLPGLSLSAPELLGMKEPKPTPTHEGFAAAFPQDKDGKDDVGAGKAAPLPKSVLDLELALAANWKEISTETDKFIGSLRNQLENKTGLEVAVLAL